MEKKVCILVMTLLIGAMVLPVAGTTNINNIPVMGPGVVDQEQTDTSEGHFLENYKIHTQEFVNYGNMIEKVEVHIGHYFGGSEPMTLSIEKPLGNKITFVTLPASAIPDHYRDWTTFDFQDAQLQKGEKYYIAIEFACCSEYEWSGAHGDPYPLGGSSHPDIDWDYAFRTIVDKSRSNTFNSPFQWFLQQYPNLFLILRLFIQRIGL
jgi:hypothetical protein